MGYREATPDLDVLLKNYFSLTFKLRDLPPEKLKESEDYRKLLRIEHRLKGLRLDLGQIVEAGLVVPSDEMKDEWLNKSRRYQELKKKYRELDEKYSRLRALEEAMEPFRALIKALQDEVNSSSRAP
jgi:hypothetical protein